MTSLPSRCAVLTASALLASSTTAAQSPTPQGGVQFAITWLGPNAITNASVQLGPRVTQLACSSSKHSCVGTVQAPAGTSFIAPISLSFGDDDYVLPTQIGPNWPGVSFQLRYRKIATCHEGNVNYAASSAEYGNWIGALERWFVARRLLKLNRNKGCDTVQTLRAAKAIRDRSNQLATFSRGFFVSNPQTWFAYGDSGSSDQLALPTHGPYFAAHRVVPDSSEIGFLEEDQLLATEVGDFAATNALLQLNPTYFASSH
jgi:hypothetical protein